MGIKTGVIKFNLGDRKRLHRGVDRNFDTAAMVNFINSPEVQERVKMRDLHGFYGHWPREQFGICPPEGGIVDGKQVSLEPALVTTYLKAYPDGTIEHEAEFAENTAGRVAQRLFKSKLGGFSTAFATRLVGAKRLPEQFGGFDYVYEPNYTENRGYKVVFDSATAQQNEMTFDGVSECMAALDSVSSKLSSLQADYDRLLESLGKTCDENQAYLSQLSKLNIKPSPVFDAIKPTFIEIKPTLDKVDFKNADLPMFVEPVQEKQPETSEQSLTERVLARLWF